jgi:hypothetical protein
VWLELAFLSTPRRKSSKVPTSSLGLNRSRRKSGVFSVDVSLGKLSENGLAEPGGDSTPGLLMGGLFGPGPMPRRGMACMLTRLAVCAVAPVVAMPSPLPSCVWKVCATSPSSSPSSMVLGVFLSTAVVSLWSLEKPGRKAGGLVGGEMWVNPTEWALSGNCKEGNAGVLPALSDRSDVSISGRRSAIAPRKGKGPNIARSAAWG